MYTQRLGIATIVFLAFGVGAQAAQNTPAQSAPKEQTQLPAIQKPKAGAALLAVQTPSILTTQTLPGGKASGDGSVRQPIGGQTPTAPKALSPAGPRATTPVPNQPLPAPGVAGSMSAVIYKAQLSDPYFGALGAWNCTNGNCVRNTLGQMPDRPALFRACRELQGMARLQRVKRVASFGVVNGPGLDQSPACPE